MTSKSNAFFPSGRLSNLPIADRNDKILLAIGAPSCECAISPTAPCSIALYPPTLWSKDKEGFVDERHRAVALIHEKHGDHDRISCH